MRTFLSGALPAPSLGFPLAVRSVGLAEIAYLLNLDIVRAALLGALGLASALWIIFARY